MKKRRIAVVTGARATYGYSKRLMGLIKKSKDLELQLIVTGMHLLKEYGLTVNEIIADGFKPAARVDMAIGGDTPAAWAKSLGVEIQGMAQVFDMLKPDVVLVSGDRAEMLAATVAAVYMNLAVAHIQAGDLSGHIDGSTRHAITKLAHIHLSSCTDSANRVKRMGEEPWRVFNVGAPQLDEVVRGEKIEPQEITRKFQIDPAKPVLLVIQHPVLTEIEEAGEQMRQTMKAALATGYQTIVIYPNADAAGQEIIKVIREYEKYPQIKAYRNVERKVFLNLLGIVSVLIGNSSAGILEAPSFKLAAINIGTRQRGRMTACNVIHVGQFKTSGISAAIRKALNDGHFRTRLKTCKNPFGDGNSSERILRILQKADLKKFLVKQMTY